MAEAAENSNNEKLAKEYLDKAKKWDDGGIYKVALHGAFGATISKLSGYNSFNGFKISAINEVTQPLLRKIDNPDMQKLVSIILGKSISDQSIAAPLINSAVNNNWLTHDDQLNLLRDYRSFKYGEISLDEWVRKLAYYDTLMWYEYNHNSIYKSNNEISILLNDELARSIPEVIGSGSFQDVMNNLVYKYVTSNGLEDSFSMYKQEASSRIVSSNKAYEDSLLNDYIDKYGVEKGRALYEYEKYHRLNSKNAWDMDITTINSNTETHVIQKEKESYLLTKNEVAQSIATDSIVMLGEANGANYASGVGAVIKTIPKIKENHERFKTDSGKIQADVVDIGTEAATLGAGAGASKALVNVPAKELIGLTLVIGLVVGQTLKPINLEFKNKIEENEKEQH